VQQQYDHYYHLAEFVQTWCKTSFIVWRKNSSSSVFIATAKWHGFIDLTSFPWSLCKLIRTLSMLYSLCPCSIHFVHDLFTLSMLHSLCTCIILFVNTLFSSSTLYWVYLFWIQFIHALFSLSMLYSVYPCSIQFIHALFSLSMLYSVYPCCIQFIHALFSLSMLYSVHPWLVWVNEVVICNKHYSLLRHLNGVAS